MAQFVDGILTVTTAGTAVPFSATDVIVQWIEIQAQNANTGLCFVGASTVVAGTGDTGRGLMCVSDSATENTSTRPMHLEGPFNLTNLYLDSTVNGDGVHYVYLTYRGYD